MRKVKFSFPVQGINKRLPHGAQPELTTPAARNVRPDDSFERRERGGSRPALAKEYSTQVAGGDYDIVLLDTVRYLTQPGSGRNEKVVASANGEVWWGDTGTLSKISTAAAGILAADHPIQSVEFAGKLYIADYDTTPISSGSNMAVGATTTTGTTVTSSGATFTDAGVSIEKHMLVLEDAGAQTAEVQTITNTGTVSGGTFTLSFQGEETNAIAYNAAAATIQKELENLSTIGVGGVAGAGGALPTAVTITFTKVGAFPIFGDAPMIVVEDNSLTGSSPQVVIAETTKGSTGLARKGSYPIEVITSQTELRVKYSPDPTAGATAINYRIERCPKILDPNDPVAGAADVVRWEAAPGKGQIPIGSKFLVNWRSRMVMADNSDPHVLRMSRQGDPHDWQITDDVYDVGRPMEFATAEAGVLGEPIIGCIDWSDNCLMIFTENSTWVLRGDPASAGQLIKLDGEIGMVSPLAWCFVGMNRAVFMSHDGLYLVSGPCGSPPASLSRERLPADLLNESDDLILMKDTHARGFYIFRSATSGAKTHYYVDISTTLKGDRFDLSFFEETFGDSNDEPRMAHQRRGYTKNTSWALIGTRNGYVMYHDEGQAQDDASTDIESYVDLFGQLVEEGMEAMLMNLKCTLAEGSGDVDFEVYIGSSAERVNNMTEPNYKGTWYGHSDAGMQHTEYPMCKGTWAKVRLKNGDSDRRWALESLIGTVRTVSRTRA
jgi:hypothetical protein